MKPLIDERGILIEEWDVLRVFHYVAAKRRQIIYMYKQARKLPDGRLVGHHLNGEFNTKPVTDSWYFLNGDRGINEGKMDGVRVVQSLKYEKLP